ncbi:MAG: DUF1214 domain-containing protein [Pseudomonadota bacterium]|nr:DUF1214 domain-containing protein [Pseudomonadota bacterium]
MFVTALALGLGSGWYLIEQGSSLTTARIGPWSVWLAAGRPGADPYTVAHVARSGRLPITSTNAMYFFARTDSEGEQLLANCEYAISGPRLEVTWWSLAVYDLAGRLISNKAERYSFSKTDALSATDGSYRIVLSRTARAGNWLPTGEAKRLQLVLRVYGPHPWTDSSGATDASALLPEIRKLRCQ